MKELSKEQIEQIEMEAELWWNDNRSGFNDFDLNDAKDAGKLEGYTAAATKHLLQSIEDKKEIKRLNDIVEHSKKLYFYLANLKELELQTKYSRIKELEDGLKDLMSSFSVLTLCPNDFSCYTKAQQLLSPNK